MDTEPFEPDLAEHGVRMDGEPASCGIESGGIIDCRACVADSTRRVLDSLMDDGKAAMVNLVRSVEAAGAAGVPESDMQVHPICARVINLRAILPCLPGSSSLYWGTA
jgi:hypothetical protein